MQGINCLEKDLLKREAIWCQRVETRPTSMHDICDICRLLITLDLDVEATWIIFCPL
jgi:hypothetical protein